MGLISPSLRAALGEMSRTEGKPWNWLREKTVIHTRVSVDSYLFSTLNFQSFFAVGSLDTLIATPTINGLSPKLNAVPD